MDSVRWLVDLAKNAHVQRIILNGSFTTDIIEPNDVDCVLLATSTFPPDEDAEADLQEGLPFLDIRLVTQDDFDFFTTNLFASDRFGVPKGIVEILI